MDLKKFKWNVGIVSIDLQHQQFVSMIYRLIDVMDELDNSCHQNRLLEEFSLYKSIYFMSEENS